jgi:hypothetical protein
MSGNKTKCPLWQHVVCLKALRALWQDSRLDSPFPEATRHGPYSPQTRGLLLAARCWTAARELGSGERYGWDVCCPAGVLQMLVRYELPVAEARRPCSGLPGRYRETKRRRKQQ